jgi:hypothetical protein
MMKGNVMITEALVLRLAATHMFRSFDDADWNAYAGCSSKDPLICERDNFVMIIDGYNLCYITNDGEQIKFVLDFDSEEQ